MIRFSMGTLPRTVRRPSIRPAQRIVLFSSEHGTVANAEGRGTITVQVSAPAVHAGQYRLDAALLARGPLCLVAPRIAMSADGSRVVAVAGLWAFDSDLGTLRLGGQWLADGKAVAAASGLALAVDATLAGLTLRYGETARQTQHEAAAASDPLALPKAEEPVPEPEDPKDPVPVDPDPKDPDPEPEQPSHTPDGLSVVYVNDGTFQVEAAPDQPLVLTLDAPHIHAGTYTITPAMMADMKDGPICLVPPAIAVDDVLTQYSVSRIGLWVYDPARGTMSVTSQWMRDGAALQTQTGPILVFSDTYRAAAITLAERAVQNGKERTRASNAVTVSASYRPADSFADVAVHNTLLENYAGLSGESWVKAHTSTTSSWINKNNGRLERANGSGPVYVRGVADRGVAQFAEAQVRRGSSSGIVVGVRIQGNSGYFLMRGTAGGLRLQKCINGSFTTIGATDIPVPGFAAAGDVAALRLEAQGDRIRFSVNGIWQPAVTDGTLTGGGVGVRGTSSTANGSGNEIISFNGGSL